MQWCPLHCLLKNLQRQLWLKRRDLMPTLKNPQPTQILHRLVSTLYGTIQCIISHFLVFKFRLA
jgi:hypothetical protein